MKIALLFAGILLASTPAPSTQAAEIPAPGHWSLTKPKSSPPPDVVTGAWPKRPLDHFVLAKLEANGLTPSPDADPATFLRRLHFDLIGLPPTPEEVAAFITESTRDPQSAIQNAADRLLASPQFGERWGRHWLDVARYAESSGKDANFTFPHAWRYRDYVIDSFNADKPYDQFITEQIAGDLLPAETDKQRAELLIATGFLAIGPKGLNEMNPIQFKADLADEQVDAVTRAITASSVACARCHDHKFDPYTMEDYYALAGIFLSTETHFGTAVGPDNVTGGTLTRLPDLPEQIIPNKTIPAQQFESLKAKLAALNQEERDRKAKAEAAMLRGENPGEFFSLQDALRIIWQRGGIEGKLRTVDEKGIAIPLCMGVSENPDKPTNSPLLARGEISKPGNPVPRGFPKAIPLPDVAPPSETQSGRLELARWLVHPAHPLTARVLTNRVWHHLLGAGIVGSVDNFGTTGSPPSHPELLDHLALTFIENGWSIKALIREITLSRTYRQSSTYRADHFKKDPENRLLWRAPKRRLDAESLRDAMLAVSGRLDLERPAAGILAPLGDQQVALFSFNKSLPEDLDGTTHRSVYLPIARDRLPDALEMFDCAEPSLVTGARESTNVPTQSLYLLNSQFMRDTATALAARLRAHSKDRPSQIRHAFELCFLRPPDKSESEFALTFFKNLPPDDPDPLTSFAQSLLSTARFRNLD